MLDATGCCFLFAPLYHPAVKAIAPVRQALAKEGIPTIFNLLGPLINPAKPEFQMVGVYDGSLVETYAKALQKLGRTRAWVVHGAGEIRLDELSTLSSSAVVESSSDGIRSFEADPALYGFTSPGPKDLQGGTPQENAKILEDILTGTDSGPKRDIVLLNAAAALTVCGITETIEAGLLRAKESLESGAARNKLHAIRIFSRSVSPNNPAA
jgi:anthranilate phosphoribosyltransferase